MIKKFFFPVLAFCLLNLSAQAGSIPAHFIAWGDEEGTVMRPGTDTNDLNQALPVLKKYLENIDKSNKIDGLLHTGDFVRFDPNEKLYKDFLGPDFLNRFYPTSGGDQEFYLGRYGRFLNAVPNLKFLYLQRVAEDRNGMEYYYHALVNNTHIISLYAPDELRDNDKNPQYTGQNVFKKKDSRQYKWLEALLDRIRVKANDDRPIIVISHGPVFNQSKLLTDLFAKFKVNLVLGGDIHVLAHKSYKGTEYFVTGMMGDRYLGGCKFINDPKSEDFITKYDYCFTDELINRKKGQPFKFYKDHFLDIMIDNNSVKIKAIELETGREISYQ